MASGFLVCSFGRLLFGFLGLSVGSSFNFMSCVHLQALIFNFLQKAGFDIGLEMGLDMV